MKPLIILVEGDTEEEFVKESLLPHFHGRNIFDITPIKITTKVGFKGGFVNYDHLKRDVVLFLKQRRETVITTFLDYFRIPHNIPNYQNCQTIHDIDARLECLETAMKHDIDDSRFHPYIQKHEFEALLFSSNAGFERYYSMAVARETEKIIQNYSNPEDINDAPQTAPSKRLLDLIPTYNKVADGNILALEIGIQTILQKCPRFQNWIETLIHLAGS